MLTLAPIAGCKISSLIFLFPSPDRGCWIRLSRRITPSSRYQHAPRRQSTWPMPTNLCPIMTLPFSSLVPIRWTWLYYPWTWTRRPHRQIPFLQYQRPYRRPSTQALIVMSLFTHHHHDNHRLHLHLRHEDHMNMNIHSRTQPEQISTPIPPQVVNVNATSRHSTNWSAST